MGTLDRILDYGNALADALYIIELKAKHGNAASDDNRLQALATELFPARLGRQYRPSSQALWHFISTTNLDGSNELETAVRRLALAYFPADEVLMAAANRGNKILALIAGCIINYENHIIEDDDPVAQTIKDANSALSAKIPEARYLL